MKLLPVDHHDADCMFSVPLKSIGRFRAILIQSSVLASAIEDCWCRIFQSGHEQTKLNRVCYFHIFRAFLATKGSYYLELVLFVKQY